ncbi:MAG: hypothetical protein GX558_11265 [Clostridiales bacterium]|nr:hypothetical protein [Clostridiales bacterium]
MPIYLSELAAIVLCNAIRSGEQPTPCRIGVYGRGDTQKDGCACGVRIPVCGK